MAELADAQRSGRCMVIHVQVRILPEAFNQQQKRCYINEKRAWRTSFVHQALFFTFFEDIFQFDHLILFCTHQLNMHKLL